MESRLTICNVGSIFGRGVRLALARETRLLMLYRTLEELDEALKELSAQFRERRRVHRKLHGELLHAQRV